MEARILVTIANNIQLSQVPLNLQKSENKNKKNIQLINGLMFGTSVGNDLSKVHVAPSGQNRN